MFSNRISSRQLAMFCRSVATPLHAGVDIIKTLKREAGKANGRLRVVLEDIVYQLKQGEGLVEAFRSHQPYFPDLFCDMLNVADETGNLPEVLRELAEHYESNIRLWNTFLGQITLPAIQLGAAILIVAGLIYLMGWISEMVSAQGGEPVDLLGWGLQGTGGALTWLGGWVLGAVSLYIAYKLAATSLSGLKLVHRALLGFPVIGTCMRKFAISRFSWAFYLTQGAGMPIDRSLDASLRATSNGAFIAAAPDIIYEVNSGATLHEALDVSQLFPREFIDIVDVGETSGTVPETLDRLSEQFEEEARRSLSGLSMAAGWVIWAGVAAFIIYIIFKLAFFYLGMINDALNMSM
ncbi:MAG: type II secretion system F family protein [Planctomycetaceae bacterium]